jgi:lipoyl(octanoyl) transferase
VITLGRKSQRQETPLGGLKPKDKEGNEIPILEVERGGQATYHGPGQIVIYPIVYLSPNKDSQVKGGVVGLIRKMEEAVITYLKEEHGLDSEHVEEPDATGVWVDGKRKITSIGIAVKKWVSYHGLAFNVSTGKEPWLAFNPCGFSGSVMTDLDTETGVKNDLEAVEAKLIEYLKSTL